MHASSALREIRVAILIFFLRNRIGSIERVRPFCLSVRECGSCPLPFKTCLGTVESMAVRARINDEQQVTALHAVSLSIRNLIYVACHPAPHVYGIDRCDTAVEFVRETNWLWHDRRNFYCCR